MRAAAWISIIFYLATAVAGAQDVVTSYSPPAGYFSLNVRGQSDNQLAIPLVEKAVAFGKVSGASPSTITVREKIWSAGSYRLVSGSQSVAYYAEFTSGALKGVRYRILDNSDDTLLLETLGDDFTAHPSGVLAHDDIVCIRPYWSVGSVMGETESDLVINPKPNALMPGDSVIFFDNKNLGQNKAPVVEVSYVRNLGWRATGDSATNQVHRTFEVGEPFIVRRLSSQSVSFVTIGQVLSEHQMLYVSGGSETSGNDAYVSLLFPEPVRLADSGLVDSSSPSTSVIASSRSKLLRADELLTYGAQTGYNLAPERTFYYLENVGWREVGNDTTTTGLDFMLEPGKAYIVRKKANNFGVDWMQSTGD